MVAHHVPIKVLIVFHICVAAELIDLPRDNSWIYDNHFASGMIKVTSAFLTAVAPRPCSVQMQHGIDYECAGECERFECK